MSTGGGTQKIVEDPKDSMASFEIEMQDLDGIISVQDEAS
jgi:hypothetical protein